MDSTDTIPEHLKCPTCQEVPRGRVYQCRRGHTLCEHCYAGITRCPQAQCQMLFEGEPIRTLVLEKMLDELTWECPFKGSGCTTPVDRSCVADHVARCRHNVNRFGPFVRACTAVGLQSCPFKMNMGNITDFIRHLKATHRAVVVDSDTYSFGSSLGFPGTRYMVLKRKEEDGCGFLLAVNITSAESKCICMSAFYWRYPSGDNASPAMEEPPPYQVECKLKGSHYMTWSVSPIDLLESESQTSELFAMQMPAYLMVDEYSDRLRITVKLVKIG